MEHALGAFSLCDLFFIYFFKPQENKIDTDTGGKSVHTTRNLQGMCIYLPNGHKAQMSLSDVAATKATTERQLQISDSRCDVAENVDVM
jgi:hypothetical protein